MRMKSVTLFVSFSALAACEPMEPPPVDINALSEACCGGIGICVFDGFVSTDLSQRLSSAECQEASAVCVPTEWLIGVSSVPTGCRAPGDVEGRCLPSCMPELGPQAARRAQQTCDAGYLCVPCFDPLTGEDTQACRIEPDPGPQEPAPALAPCCHGAGRCAARSALQAFSEADLQHFGPDACGSEQDVLCVPESWLAAAGPIVAASCRVVDGLEGRCLPRCMPEVAALTDPLQQGSCAAEELCVPCDQALSGLDAQACHASCDSIEDDHARQLVRRNRRLREMNRQNAQDPHREKAPKYAAFLLACSALLAVHFSQRGPCACPRVESRPTMDRWLATLVS